MRRLVLALWLLGAAGARGAADEEAALALADATADAPAAARAWKLQVETAASVIDQRGGDAVYGQRLSLDLQVDHRAAPGWRTVLAERVDLRSQDVQPHGQTVGTLKEAYVSWQPHADDVFDLGRVNPRQGAALGWNPTDWFRDAAVRSLVSPDPASLRDNRLGSVMLRGQHLWSGGSLSALVSPRLADRPASADLDPDLGATNHRNRWLVAGSQALGGGFAPQWLVQGGEGQALQWGVNATALLSAATVVFLEAATGRAPSQAAAAGLGPPDDAWRTRSAAGLTWSSASKLSLSAELEYNGAALDRDAWRALGAAGGAAYAAYRQAGLASQDPPTRHNLFLMAAWQDAGVQHLDLSGFLRLDLDDHSRTPWLELRYRWPRTELALQWQMGSGGPGTQFAGLPQRQAWQALALFYF